jgi:hypothetical protein
MDMFLKNPHHYVPIPMYPYSKLLMVRKKRDTETQDSHKENPLERHHVSHYNYI